MTQNVGSDAFNILWRDVSASVQERVCTRGQRKINGGARRGAVANETDPFIFDQVVWFTRRPNNVDDVILYAIVDVNALFTTERAAMICCGSTTGLTLRSGAEVAIKSRMRRSSAFSG